jgi:hypothetical protein
LRTLYQRHTDMGDGDQWVRRVPEVEPGDQTFQNNFAQVALLLKVDMIGRGRWRRTSTGNSRLIPPMPPPSRLLGRVLPKQLEDERSARIKPTTFCRPHCRIFLSAAGDLEKSKPSFRLPRKPGCSRKSDNFWPRPRARRPRISLLLTRASLLAELLGGGEQQWHNRLEMKERPSRHQHSSPLPIRGLFPHGSVSMALPWRGLRRLITAILPGVFRCEFSPPQLS